MTQTSRNWDPYLGHPQWKYEDIENDESYKLEIARDLIHARLALVNGSDDWYELAVAAIKRKDNNLFGRWIHGKVIDWIDGNTVQATTALLGMWAKSDKAPDARIRAFDVHMPLSVFSRESTGTRCRVASIFMMGLDQQEFKFPPYGQRAFNKAYAIVGNPQINRTDDVGCEYQRALEFLDLLLAEAQSRKMTFPCTRMDAQSIIWQIFNPSM